ncbi:hypothetical protein QCA50_020793 [Cerrena zonata]|uniref:Guanine nucleotide-binding protein-like 3 N-terminal domain-containing protein n=1 Tax=Cerrena zonata TaxID=2478898 RepID=A0AAW0F9U2_9APHY
MRVKKPTSKRTTTRMREGIKKKAAAQNRKNKKLAKKDVTWKSRHKKDPGIPASFPYKDKIISELEENRRIEKERKEQQRIEKQREREEALARGEDVEDEMEAEEDEGNGLTALLESAQQAAKAYEGDDAEDEDDAMVDSDEDVEYDISDVEDDEANEATIELEKSRKAYDKIFKTVVEHADVILYVLDARDPEATRSKKVEEAVLQNPVKASPGASGSTSFNKNLTSSMTANSLLQALKSYAAKSNLKRSIIVGVIGYPNVACPVGNQAGVTTSMREVKIDGKLKIIDSPGIVFPDEIMNSKKTSKTNQEAKLALLSAIPPKQILDPIPAVNLLLRKFSKDNEMADGLKTYYQLPPLPSSNFEEFSKGGVPNLNSAAVSVLNDWRDGRILGWTLPRASKKADLDADIDLEAPKSALRGEKEPPKVEQTTVVSTWAKEFDLDGLLGDNFGLGA